MQKTKGHEKRADMTTSDKLAAEKSAEEMLFHSDYTHNKTVHTDAFLAGIAHERKRADRLLWALRFYGEKANYADRLATLSCGCCSSYEDSAISEDVGKKARQALADYEKEGGER